MIALKISLRSRTTIKKIEQYPKVLVAIFSPRIKTLQLRLRRWVSASCSVNLLWGWVIAFQLW